MIDLDERLQSASSAIRSQITKTPMPPPTVVWRRHRHRRAVSVATGVVVGLIVFAGVSVLLTGGNGFASDPGPEPAHTYTLDLPSWQLAGAWETPDGAGTSHTLFDRIVDGAPRRVTIESGSEATDRVVTIEGLQIVPTTRFSLGGEEAIVYDTTEIFKNEDQAALVAWSTAVVTWTDPSDRPVAFLFEGVDVNEAASLLVAHLKPVSRNEWQAIATSYAPPVTTANAAAPEQALMAIAVPIGHEDIYTKDLEKVMAVEEDDQLFAVPVGEYRVLARFREGKPPHLYATSCDALAQVDLPDGWEGTCLERTIDGQRVSGIFEYGDTSG